MNQFELSLIQTAAIAVISLFIGLKIKNRFEFMDKYCIPSAVVGGLVVSIILSILYKVSGIFLTLDETIEDIFMIVFFTSIGFQVNLYVLRNIMRPLLVMICCIAVCIVLQNVLVLTIANLNGTNPYLAMTAGSITMMGGEGLARIYGPILMDFNLLDGISLTHGLATMGLIIGAVLGGPLGRYLIVKHNLKPDQKELEVFLSGRDKNEPNDNSRIFERIGRASYQLIITMAIGITICQILKQIGFVVPLYIGTMISAIIIKNVFIKREVFDFHVREISYIGGLSLSLFLGISFSELELFYLFDLKPIQLFLLALQVILILAFALCIFKFSGKNYDAAILSGASLGFGIGATPSGISSIIALNGKFGYSIKAYLLVPIAGTMFADPINSLVIEYFIKLI